MWRTFTHDPIKSISKSMLFHSCLCIHVTGSGGAEGREGRQGRVGLEKAIDRFLTMVPYSMGPFHLGYGSIRIEKGLEGSVQVLKTWPNGLENLSFSHGSNVFPKSLKGNQECHLSAEEPQPQPVPLETGGEAQGQCNMMWCGRGICKGFGVGCEYCVFAAVLNPSCIDITFSLF